MRKNIPKWHDETCETLKRKIKHTSSLLKTYPKNAYLRGCLQVENKMYKKLIKSKHNIISKIQNLKDIYKLL